MPIIFSVVSRGLTTLAKHATCPGNFNDVTDYILAKIPPQDGALTYAQGPYLFHYLSENGFIYMCITDDAFQRLRAFLFLLEIHRRFQRAYGDSALTVLPHVINTEFSLVLANEMKHYSTSRDVESASSVRGELDEIMTRSVDNTVMTGENVRLLLNDGGNLAERYIPPITPEQRRAIFRRTVMFYGFVVFAHVLLGYLLVSMICGGFAWQECV